MDRYWWIFGYSVGTLKSATDFIFECVSSSFKKSTCATNHCGCATVNLACTDLCGCTNCKNNDNQEGDDINEIFNDDNYFDEYQDEDTDGEADDSSNSSEDELFDDDEIDND